MTQQTLPARPLNLSWNLGDRLRKALDAAGISVKEMSLQLGGVSGASMSNWTSGRVTPSDETIRRWAEITGAPLSWLRMGTLADQIAYRQSLAEESATDVLMAPLSQLEYDRLIAMMCAVRDLNPEPAD